MSEENVDVVRGLYAVAEKFLPTAAATAYVQALADADDQSEPPETVATLMDFFTDDVVWAPSYGTFHGHEGVIEAIAQWMEVMGEWRWVSYEFTDAGGDEVLAEVKTQARGKGSGVATEQDFFIIYTVRAGKIAGYEEFVDRHAARAAIDARR